MGSEKKARDGWNKKGRKKEREKEFDCERAKAATGCARHAQEKVYIVDGSVQEETDRDQNGSPYNGLLWRARVC